MQKGIGSILFSLSFLSLPLAQAQVRNCNGSTCFTCSSQSNPKSVLIEHFVEGRLVSSYVKYDSFGIIEVNGMLVPEAHLDAERSRREIQFLQAREAESKQIDDQLKTIPSYTILIWKPDSKPLKDWPLPDEKNPGYGFAPQSFLAAFKANTDAPIFYSIESDNPKGSPTRTLVRTSEEGQQIVNLRKKHEIKNTWTLAKNSNSTRGVIPEIFQRSAPALGTFTGKVGVVNYSLVFSRTGQRDMESPQLLNYRIGNDSNVQVQNGSVAATKDSVWQQVTLIQDLLKETSLKCSSMNSEEVAFRLETFRMKKEPSSRPPSSPAKQAKSSQPDDEASGAPGSFPFDAAPARPMPKPNSPGKR